MTVRTPKDPSRPIRVVVDASVAIKWLIPATAEPQTGVAVALFRQLAGDPALALQPPHWITEVLGVAVRIDPAAVTEHVRVLHDLEFATDDRAEIYLRAADLAISLRQHIFDTMYHAVAMENNAVLITADERYYTRAAALGNIMLLSHWPAKDGGVGKSAAVQQLIH